MISPQCSMLAKHLDGQLAGGKIEQQNCIHSICSYDTAEFSAPSISIRSAEGYEIGSF